MSESNIVKMAPFDLCRLFSVNVMDYDVWAEGDLYRNVKNGEVKYETEPDENSRRPVMGDGWRNHHDDTPGIQAAINEAAVHGGCVYFPMHVTPDVIDEAFPSRKHRFARYYRLDSEAKAFYDPVNNILTDDAQTDGNDNFELRAQLAIPPGGNVYLLGEVPPPSLRHYHVLTGDKNTLGFHVDGVDPIQSRGVVLRSSVDAPSTRVSYEDRPWSVIAAPSGSNQINMRVSSSSEAFFMKNMEIRVHIEVFGRLPRLYPTMGAVNLMNVRRMHVEDCFFGLDNEIGSNYVGDSYTAKGRCLQKSATTTVGLFGAIDDCAEQKLIHVTVQGFKFGMVLPEMTNANFIHISNTEYALCFIDCTHASLINHLSTHSNRRCICVLPIKNPTIVNSKTVLPKVFGCRIKYPEWDNTDKLQYNPDYKPAVHVRILEHDYETGHFQKPLVSQMRFGVWDPQNRLHGTIVYHQGYPGDAKASRNLNDMHHGASWEGYRETELGSGSVVIDGESVTIAGGRPMEENRRLERVAKMGTLDHCMYDHREGGEAAALFASDEDVNDWIDADWTEEPYDFIAYHSDFIEKCTEEYGKLIRVDFSSITDYQEVGNVTYSRDIVGAESFFKSRNALPPCPVLNGTRYTPPDHGDYYPVLGASGVSIVPLRDTRKEGSYPFVEVEPETDESPDWAFENVPDGYEIESGAWRSANGESNMWTFLVKGGNYGDGTWITVSGVGITANSTSLNFNVETSQGQTQVTASRASSLSCRLQDRTVSHVDCDGKGTFYVVLPPQSPQGARDFYLALDNVSGMNGAAEIIFSRASSFEPIPELSSMPNADGTWHFFEKSPGVFSVNDISSFPSVEPAEQGGTTPSLVTTGDKYNWNGYAAQIAAKANAIDLPYALVTPGEWDFSGIPSGATNITFVWDSSRYAWLLGFTIGGSFYTMEGAGIDEDALNVTCEDENYTVIATRASLPGHLLDRANNLIDATTGNVTLTLPTFVAGKVRDLLVACTIGLDANDEPWSVIFQGADGEAISFKAEGDDAASATFPVPTAAGDWWYSLTERTPHVFAVSLKQLQSVSQTQTQGGS